MMGMRAIVSITNGKLDPDMWVQAALDEAPVQGPSKACVQCPLRKNGAWETNTIEAVESMMSCQRSVLTSRWGCHEGNRPCAGMQRIVQNVKENANNPQLTEKT